MVHNSCVEDGGGNDGCLKAFQEIVNKYDDILDNLVGDAISDQMKKNLKSWACKRTKEVGGFLIKWDAMGFPDFWDAVAESSTGKKASFDISLDF